MFLKDLQPLEEELTATYDHAFLRMKGCLQVRDMHKY
jgi:hypothetical protein